MTALDVIEVVAVILSVCALALIFSTVVAAGIGMWLEERSRGYRLPYEQPSHVRLCPFDQDAAS